jgi:hypothetical protein
MVEGGGARCFVSVPMLRALYSGRSGTHGGLRSVEVLAFVSLLEIT